MSQVKQNIRIRFGKQGDLRFISHHDLMRLFERALRRADLPVAMSEGHRPRPRISLPLALGVGLHGRNEVLDVGLSQWMRPDEVQRRLAAELPEGLRIRSIELTGPHPNRQPRELTYRVPLLPGHGLDQDRIDELMARDRVQLERPRKDSVKQVEIRQFIASLRLEQDAVLMLLRYTEAGTARPEEVLEALGCREAVDYAPGQIVREHVTLSPAR